MINTEHRVKQSQGILEIINTSGFVKSVQIDPPTVFKIEEFKEILSKLKESGIWLVDINSSRRVSHDSIQLGVALSQLGFEVISHTTTRDSSINGLINQILAAYSWGNLRNFLVITGDPYEASQAIVPSKGIFQTDSIGAINAINIHLREKRGLDIVLAAAVNQNEENLESEGMRLNKKELAGADFFMSQPVFNTEQVVDLVEFYDKYSQKPLLIGIWPLIDTKTITMIRSGRIAGVVIPDNLNNEASRFSNNENKLHCWGLEKASVLINLIRELKSQTICGVYIVAPSRDPSIVTKIY